MIYTYNGDSINARPPISAISANKLKVVFRDSQKLVNISFNNVSEKRKFLNWLVTI